MKVLILNHTHWDREWYDDFETLRFRLYDSLKKVISKIENNEIDSFFFDGQTVIIEDFQEIASKEDFEKFENLIYSKKVEVGPWYLLTDEFLVSQESLIKNLQIGISIASKYNSFHNIGYLPDTFGHISQMPQIFKLFNIDFSLIWRGSDSLKFENIWIGSDGSKINTFSLPLFDGYYQTYLKQNNYFELVEKYVNDNKIHLESDICLLLNGADHTLSIDKINDKVILLNKKFKEDFKQTSMEDFLKNSFNFKNEIHGELRENNKIFLLPGVLSSRIYLKQQNQSIEDAMTHHLEAMNVFNNDLNNNDFKLYLWKLLLKNHPHDSICGCSIDNVHKEMETRFLKIKSGINEFLKNSFQKKHPFLYAHDNKYLIVYNTLPFERKMIVKTKIKVLLENDLNSISLTYQNKNIDIVILKKEKKEVLETFDILEYVDYYIYDIEFIHEFSSFEYKCFDIHYGDFKENHNFNDNDYIENDFYKITPNLDVFSKKSLKTYENQHIFESILDSGDSYNSSYVENSATFFSKIIDYKILKNSLFEQLNINYCLSTYSKKDILIYTEVKLYKNIKRIEFSTSLNNNVKNHKLLLTFKIKNCEFSYADSTFDIIKRKNLNIKPYEVLENKESVVNQNPSHSIVKVDDLLFIHTGLQEFEIIDNYLKVTLLRGFNDLSRRDLKTRGGGAGPSLETLEGQCLRKHFYKYAIDFEETINSNLAKDFRINCLTSQSSFKKEEQFFKITNSSFSNCELKRKNCFEIRLFNPNDFELNEEIHFFKNILSINEIDFLGNKIKSYEKNNLFKFVFSKKEIKTFEVEYEG